jgi:hypothetical protein
MKEILEPIESLKLEVNNILNYLGFEKNKFIVYHVRLGDSYIDNQLKSIQINKINTIINKLDIQKDKHYLLISDSVFIKKILVNKYPNIKIIMNKITHSLNNDFENIKNILVDFYLMSHAEEIISFSSYKHGSGFSKWCSVTYDINYKCYLL